MNGFSYLDDEKIPPPPLSPELRLALTLMSTEERARLTQIATHFAQDPKDEEGEEGV